MDADVSCQSAVEGRVEQTAVFSSEDEDVTATGEHNWGIWNEELSEWGNAPHLFLEPRRF